MNVRAGEPVTFKVAEFSHDLRQRNLDFHRRAGWSFVPREFALLTWPMMFSSEPGIMKTSRVVKLPILSESISR